MSRKPVDSSRYDAANLEWAKGFLANWEAAKLPEDGMVRVARATVDRLEPQKNLDRPTPEEGKESQWQSSTPKA